MFTISRLSSEDGRGWADDLGGRGGGLCFDGVEGAVIINISISHYMYRSIFKE